MHNKRSMKKFCFAQMLVVQNTRENFFGVYHGHIKLT